MFGHQYLRLTNWYVLLIPGCPYTGVSWWVCMKVHLCSIFPVTTRRPSLYHTPSIFFRWCASTHGLSSSSFCTYIGSAASISSWATILLMGGARCTVPARTKTWSGSTTTSLLSSCLGHILVILIVHQLF